MSNVCKKKERNKGNEKAVRRAQGSLCKGRVVKYTVPKRNGTTHGTNVGGAASAPIIAAAFHPSLASVGVLLAVLGYAVGTYGALLCAYLMEVAS